MPPHDHKPGQLTAMISSTALDLPAHRAAVKEACIAAGFFPIGMEHLPARDASGIKVSLELVDQADIYLGVYAWRYGWVPDFDNAKKISITEMEFDRAVERKTEGKLREILIFTAHKEHPCTFEDVEADKDAQKRLTEFKTKAADGRVRKEFKSAEELRRLISEALHHFLQRERSEAALATSTPHTSIPHNLPSKPGDAKPKRFRIAFSFAGEKREFVEKVARILASRFGEDKILYDRFHEAEFAVFDLGIKLPKLYGEQSDLIVPVICPNYDAKRWAGWEWVHIYGLLTKADGNRVMPSRFGHAQADGLSPASGFIDLDKKTPEQFANLILERLAISEGLPKNHYTKPVIASDDSRILIHDNIISGKTLPPSPQASPKAAAAHDVSVPPPRVFISYSWDSAEHKQRVLQLAQRLRGEGLDARMDRFVPFPTQGWLSWMRSELKAAQFVLVVATETYRERFEKNAPTGIGLGVTWEGAIITQALFDGGLHNEKFIPIVFDSTDAEFVPDPLRAFKRFCIETEEGYDSLYRLLTNQPEIVAAPIGSIRLRESKFGV